MTLLRCLLMTCVLASCGGAVTHEPTLDSIPPPAAAALTAQAGAAAIINVSREMEHGRELYEGAWMEDGLEREAKVTATGELVELEIQVREVDVPGPVRVAAAKSLEGATTIKYVKLKGELYEAEAVINGKERDVTLTASGAPAAGDGEDDDDDDDDESDGDQD